MKFLLITLITHVPDPLSGEKSSPADRLREVIDKAVLAEELGFDGFAMGERHEDPFIWSSTCRAEQRRGPNLENSSVHRVTTLSLLDPVRAFEDYSTLDNLSGGRLELIIGKGNGAAQAELFNVTTADQWDRNREGYELFRLLWENEHVTWSGRFRPPLVNAKALPRPLQTRIRIWHGSATSTDSVDLAARHGDPIFSANVSHPIEPYAKLVAHYRQRWEFYGHRPEDALVGAGTAGFYVAPTSQEAVATYRPMIEARLAAQRRAGIPAVFESVDDFVERSSALVGSPEQVIDKVGRYHEQLGHEAMHLSADAGGVTAGQQRRSLELFQSDVAPVLRQRISSRPLISQSKLKEVAI